MRRNEYGVRLSASDLVRLARGAHATTLDLAWTTGRGAAPGEDGEDAKLLQRHGGAHTARRLAARRAAGRGGVPARRVGAARRRRHGTGVGPTPSSQLLR
jgi:hypothetical protein